MEWFNSKILNKKRVPFQVKFIINDLKNVPFLSGLYYAKWKLLSNGSGTSSGISYHMPIKQNTVVFNTEFSFQVNIPVDKNRTLQRTDLWIIIKQDLQVAGSKAIEKIGSCLVNLADLAPPCPLDSEPSDIVPEPKVRRYLLSDSKLNAILTVSVLMQPIRTANADSANADSAVPKKRIFGNNQSQSLVPPSQTQPLFYLLPSQNDALENHARSSEALQTTASLLPNLSNLSLNNAARSLPKNPSELLPDGPNDDKLLQLQPSLPRLEGIYHGESPHDLDSEKDQAIASPSPFAPWGGPTIGTDDIGKTVEQVAQSLPEIGRVAALGIPGNLQLDSAQTSTDANSKMLDAVRRLMELKRQQLKRENGKSDTAEQNAILQPRSLLSSPVTSGGPVSPQGRRETLENWGNFDAKSYMELLSPPGLPENPHHNRQISALMGPENAAPPKLSGSRSVGHSAKAAPQRFLRSHPFQTVASYEDGGLEPEFISCSKPCLFADKMDEAAHNASPSILKPPFLPNLPSDKLVRILFEYAIYNVKKSTSLARTPASNNRWTAVLPAKVQSFDIQQLPATLQSHEKAVATFRQKRTGPEASQLSVSSLDSLVSSTHSNVLALDDDVDAVDDGDNKESVSSFHSAKELSF